MIPKWLRDIHGEQNKIDLTETESERFEDALKKAMAGGKMNWKPVYNPLSCFIDRGQIVLKYEDSKGNYTAYYMEAHHAKEIWQQLIKALLEVGAFSKQGFSEEEKQAMVDAAIKVKNEL